MPVPTGRASRRPRPSYLALPPLLLESEPFEGAAILRELPGSLGAVLWKSLRDVSAYVAAPPGERRAAFPAGAAAAREHEIAGTAAEPELWAPLLVIARMAADADAVDLARLVNACRGIARWGERRGYGAVQLGFTQAAARLAPESPRLAYAVGRLARDRGEYARGESWLRLAVRLARRTDWHTYTLAYLSLGTLYQQLGNLPAARTLTLRGYRTSVRRRVHALRGTALHNLFVITAEMHSFGRAQELARAAFDAYEPSHPRMSALANDISALWIMTGRFPDAIRVLKAVVPRCPDPRVRIVAIANLARAAGAMGDHATFQAMWDEAHQMFRTTLPIERVAESWINLARGAISLRDRARARHATASALAIASRLRLGQILMEAEAVDSEARSIGTRAEQPQPPIRRNRRIEEFSLALEQTLVSAAAAA